MLYWVTFLQIICYLFAMPLMRMYLSEDLGGISYPFHIAITFGFSFLVGAIMVPKKAAKHNPHLSLNISSPGIFLILGLAAFYISVSLSYGLYNRRIGTEAAAELFGSLPPEIIVCFRVYEIVLPVIISIGIVSLCRHKKITFKMALLAVGVLISFLFTGVLFSRSGLAITLIGIFLLLQNHFNQNLLRRYLLKGIFLSLLFFSAVTIFRITSIEDDTISQYVYADVIKRLDGMELVSLVIESKGETMFGYSFAPMLNPIISSIPFFEEARELKSLGLTTAKSVILDSALNNSSRDYNSFMITDVYFTFGLFGVLLAGFFVGVLSKVFDRNIGIASRSFPTCLLIAYGLNFLVLEKDFSVLVIGTMRDAFVIYFILKIVTLKKVVYPTEIGNKRAATNAAV